MARDYAKIRSRYWTGDTGKRLRAAGQEAQLVGAYLVSCGSSNMIGLYYLPLALIAHEVAGMTMEGASKTLRRLSEADFAYYDEDEEVVFVPHMAAEQIAERLSPNDKQVQGVIAALQEYRKSRFFNEFVRVYKEAFHLPFEIAETSPLEAPSKTLRSQEQEQEQEQEEENCAEVADDGDDSPHPSLLPPEPSLLAFPCAKGRTWHLTESVRAELSEAYPAVDVMSVARRALEWCRANPRKVKTFGRMRGWLGSVWCADEQNRPRQQPQKQQKPQQGQAIYDDHL